MQDNEARHQMESQQSAMKLVEKNTELSRIKEQLHQLQVDCTHTFDQVSKETTAL